MEAADLSSAGIIPIDTDDRWERRRLLEDSANFSTPILTRNSSMDDKFTAGSIEEEEVGEDATDVSESNEDVNSILSNTTIDVRTSTSRRTKVDTDTAAIKTKTLTKKKKKKT